MSPYKEDEGLEALPVQYDINMWSEVLMSLFTGRKSRQQVVVNGLKGQELSAQLLNVLWFADNPKARKAFTFALDFVLLQNNKG